MNTMWLLVTLALVTVTLGARGEFNDFELDTTANTMSYSNSSEENDKVLFDRLLERQSAMEPLQTQANNIVTNTDGTSQVLEYMPEQSTQKKTMDDSQPFQPHLFKYPDVMRKMFQVLDKERDFSFEEEPETSASERLAKEKSLYYSAEYFNQHSPETPQPPAKIENGRVFSNKGYLLDLPRRVKM